MKSLAIHASPNVIPTRSRFVRSTLVAFVAALVLAYVGALGTGAAPFALRFAYWNAVILPGSMLGFVVTALVRGWGKLAHRRWAEIGLVALAVSIPHTFLVVVSTALFFGIDAITLGVVANFGTAVLVLALILTMINFLVSDETSDPDTSARSEGSEQCIDARGDDSELPCLPPLLAEKLSPHLRAGRLIAITAEDHYLRVHTDLGHDLVLMRMSDACALLPETVGARVHRSWWVAKAAVVLQTVDGSRMQLKLHNGASAPVSRSMRPIIREQGWGRSEGG